ncbi:CD209 antigen-like protein A [Podarcis raffonei]|uniref:CD209 antigen-like protein A n=1 Tax=Podarcis raffonei TaxID=65483 RepID=UPI0023298158|nr:CD209 antigen-like protein A [Podarcis raffonei]
MGKPTPAKRAASRRHLALRKRKARAKETVASGFQDLVNFFQSPTGERFIILEICILIAMTLLVYILYQKEVQRREELQEAMHMIRTFVVGMEPFYVDKDDFQILAVAQNKSEEMRYYSQKNEELQKEIDILTRNLNDGWVLYSRAFYFFSLELQTWMDSKKKCEKEGAHLISMETKEEQYFINKQVKHRKMIFWIGVFKNKGNKWSWLSGMEAAVHYWNYYEPSYKENHNCGAMTFDCYYENCWNALDCDLQKQYICKKGPDDAWL